ncbi:hypothetical protein GYMLUDRAFT_59360 [Collybiopsis luxurians FD-317 M1]|uniref:Uncharacterized protein n=1 Tax=Collybiopsis luxurians FD-317 M1 TaxID=944289 RepID=A0A0D0CDN9_9AGAR|nr:hypothetical protein GYMLUDRAFT_59360 [Collybiopsis luxurians FD-317 M1]
MDCYWSSTGTSSDSAHHSISFVPGPTLFPEPGDSYLLEGSAPQPKKPWANFKAWSAKRKGESSKSGGGHSGGSGKGRNASKKGGKGKKKKTKLQTSLHLHISILWNMLGHSSVLKPVNGASIIEFDQKFADTPQPSLKEHVEGMLKASATSNAQVLTARMFSSVAAVGLSYQALLGDLAYVQIAPGDLVLHNQMERCRSIYCKYVFGYQAQRLQLEMKEEGTNEKRDALVNTYKCRTQILIQAPIIQSISSEKRLGTVDLLLNSSPGQQGDCIWKTQEDAQCQSLPHLPMDVLIDYFSPNYFNNFLSAKLHAHYAANGVALPLEQHCQVQGEVESWKNMKEEEFVEAYGNAVLALYHILTQKELDQMDEYNYTNDDEDMESEE